jgi:hypothetical protein
VSNHWRFLRCEKEYGDSGNVPHDAWRSKELRLVAGWLFRFAAGRTASDGAAENALQPFDKTRSAERPSGLLCRSKFCEPAVAGRVGDECREVPHAIEHRSDSYGPVVLTVEVGSNARPCPVFGAGGKPRAHHTNTIEGYFSILKRGIIGTYHHVSPQHLKRYLAEFDYRYNERSALDVDDALRMEKSVGGIVGKRLTYRRTCREGEPVRT